MAPPSTLRVGLPSDLRVLASMTISIGAARGCDAAPTFAAPTFGGAHCGSMGLLRVPIAARRSSSVLSAASKQSTRRGRHSVRSSHSANGKPPPPPKVGSSRAWVLWMTSRALASACSSALSSLGIACSSVSSTMSGCSALSSRSRKRPDLSRGSSKRAILSGDAPPGTTEPRPCLSTSAAGSGTLHSAVRALAQ